MDTLTLLRSLQRKKAELESALSAIDDTFRDLGLSLTSVASAHPTGLEASALEIQRAGLRMKDELSFRGMEKVKEIFAFLDRDRDGCISYEDVRGEEYHET